MDLKKLNEKLDQIKLEKETKEALLDVINEKISDDMKEVIAEIKGLNTKLDTSIGALKESILSNRNEFNSKVDSIKWIVGVGITLATVIIGAINILSRFFIK